ncbi:MAG: CsbD family protein [Ramlibacter sp.]|nr:CsbD family protein [Ramlibacter sp.]
MNKDQVKGVSKEATGEVKEHVGRALGDKELEAKGHAKEMEGKLQKKLGDTKEAVKDTARDLEDNIRRDDDALDRK